MAWLGLFHLAVLAALLAPRSGREQLRARAAGAAAGWRELRDRWLPDSGRSLAAWAIGAVLLVLLARALLFVPEAADPYHLVKMWLLGERGTLAPAAAADPKINGLGYLYELALADLTFGSGALFDWVGLQGPLLYLLFLIVAAWGITRAAAPLPAAALLLPALVPAVFHQGILVKNDLFAALLALPALVWLHHGRGTASGAWWIGGLLGLAAAAKITMAPLALAAGLFLPWRPLPRGLQLRVAAAGGFLAAAAAGGLFYVAAQNIAAHGSATGFATATGNAPESMAGALVSLGRFLISWFDAGVITRQIWPGRGGWGGAFGPIFVWALVVSIVRAREDRAARRALGIALSALVPFALLYPDADVAHRMAIAPAVFLILAAVWIEAPRGTLRRWTPVAATAALAVALSGALVTRSSAFYLTQAEYLRSPELARAAAGEEALARTEAWRLRAANAALAGASRVCTVGQEHMLALRGLTFEPLAATETGAPCCRIAWRPEAIERCDALFIGPDAYPSPPPPEVREWIESCAGGLFADRVRGIRCGS